MRLKSMNGITLLTPEAEELKSALVNGAERDLGCGVGPSQSGLGQTIARLGWFTHSLQSDDDRAAHPSLNTRIMVNIGGAVSLVPD